MYEKYGTKPEAPNTAPDPSLRMEQPMRDPSYACTMNARPAMSADVPPVDTCLRHVAASLLGGVEGASAAASADEAVGGGGAVEEAPRRRHTDRVSHQYFLHLHFF